MKVESVDSFPLRVKMNETLRGGTFVYGDYQAVLVKVVCDGIAGWGEAMSRSDPRALAMLVNYLARSLTGTEVAGVKSAWESLWKSLRVRGHTRGADVEALSGIEMALYDCFGKLRGVRVGELFNRSPDRSVRCFAGSLFESRGPLSQQVEVAKSRGLAGAKVKVGFGAERDSELVAEVRKRWPEGILVADANGAYDSTTAARVCSALEKFGISWFEEPVLSDDWEGYASLRKSRVRIGAGESWFVSDFERSFSEGLAGVLEPSVSRCGGIGVEMEVGMKARKAGVGFSPMTGMNSGLSLAASLHAAAACGAEVVEFNPFTNPLQTELVAGIPDPKDGMVKLPEGPGLGVEVDQSFVKRNLVS